jgi:hypothetical protein
MLGLLIFSLLGACILIQLGYAIYIMVAAQYEAREFERWNDKIKRNYNLSD